MRRKIGNDEFSIKKQVKGVCRKRHHHGHFGRQSRPNLRAFKSFSELSGDVENFELRHFVYHSGAMYTVLYHFWSPFARFSRVFAPQRYTPLGIPSKFVVHCAQIDFFKFVCLN